MFRARNFISFGVFLGTLFLFIPFFFCQAENEKVGLSLDQSIFSFDVLPGQQQEFILNIKNIIDKEQRVSLVIQDFSLENDNQTSFLPDKNEMFGMKDWIKAEEDVWILKAGEERRIKFIIEAPAEASVGSHYSAVSFKVLPTVDGENFQKTIVGGQIGAYIFVNVLGDISGRGKIENFEVPRLVNKEANFKAVFKNEGNIHYIPHGGIEIKNILNGGKTDEKLEKHFVFPGKTFSYEYDWSVPSLFGIYTAKAYFIDQEGRNLEEEKLIIGKYFLIIFIVAFIFMVIILIFFIKKGKKKKELMVSGDLQKSNIPRAQLQEEL